MNLLDDAACYRILASRDARYDGRFFVGVKTTGVYCRPVCRVRMPKPSSCVFFPSAVTAQIAGFRSCLRCRPELAPAFAAWNGTSTTVDRALSLIAGGALDDERFDRFAARLGIGQRHLRRLFAEHLGTTPIAVVQNRRLLFAKLLLNETALPMTHVAMAAGYGSVRRFNEALHDVYGRTPTELRKTRAASSDSGGAGAVALSLPYSGPFDWDVMAGWLGSRAIGGVEEVNRDGRYVRSIVLGGVAGLIDVRPGPAGANLIATIRFPEVSQLLGIVERIKRIFDLDADIEGINAHLRSDSHLRALIDRLPGLRVPGAWDGYELAVRAVLGQQISVGAASKLAARLVERFGSPLPAGLLNPESTVRLTFPAPAVLAESDIAALGMPRTRAETIRAVARAAADDPRFFEPMHDLAGSIEHLRRLPGIGDWTAHYIAMRALREPDAFPDADVGLMRALAGAGGVRPSARELERISAPWSPWRAYAAVHLWA